MNNEFDSLKGDFKDMKIEINSLKGDLKNITID